jgi:hypothetical protein
MHKEFILYFIYQLVFYFMLYIYKINMSLKKSHWRVKKLVEIVFKPFHINIYAKVPVEENIHIFT